MKSVPIVVLFIVLLSVYGFSYLHLQDEREKFFETDFIEYVLPSAFTGPASLEFKGITSDFLLFKFMAIFGSRIDKINRADDKYWGYVYNALDTITDLDPYYFDAYLFAEMLLTLHAGKIEYANNLLLKGNTYITNDYRIPYYLGFNYYYYLKDNANGAKYMMEASKIPGSRYYLASLAARLSAYSSQHRVGIVFLEDMICAGKVPVMSEDDYWEFIGED